MRSTLRGQAPALLLLLLLNYFALGSELFETSKQRVAQRVRRENTLGLRWVVKLVPGADADAIAPEFGFRNDGPVRDLLDSYVFTVLPEHEQQADTKVQQLLQSGSIITYVPFSADKIKQKINEELNELEKRDPASAQQYKQSVVERETEAQKAASENMINRVQEVLSEHGKADSNIKQKLLQSQITQQHAAPPPPSQVRGMRKNEWVVMLQDGNNADELAAQYGFLNKGEVIGSQLNNYIFKLKDDSSTNTHTAAADIARQVHKLEQDPAVINVIAFNLEELKKKRDELARLQQTPQTMQRQQQQQQQQTPQTMQQQQQQPQQHKTQQTGRQAKDEL